MKKTARLFSEAKSEREKRIEQLFKDEIERRAKAIQDAKIYVDYLKERMKEAKKVYKEELGQLQAMKNCDYEQWVEDNVGTINI